MSSTAPQLRQRVASRLDQLAAQRARLVVVPRPRTVRAPKVPFITLVSAILLAGIIGLLLFNTSMQQASFRETALEAQARDLSARQQALQMEVQDLADDTRIARLAQEVLGMVIPTTPAGVVDLATGEIDGDPEPATPEGELPLYPPKPERPDALDPDPVIADPQQAGRSGVPDMDRDRARLRLREGRHGARR